MPGLSSTTLNINNAQVADTGEYVCTASYNGVRVSSNIARLTVFGMTFKKIASPAYWTSKETFINRACFCNKIAGFSADKKIGPQKCPVYLKLP